MANEDETCPDCGTDHPQGVSEDLLRLFKRFKEADNHLDRVSLATEIAEVALMEHDFTDPNLTDEYHRYYEDFQRARDEYERSSLKLARLNVGVIESYLQGLDTTVEAVLGLTDKAVN